MPPPARALIFDMDGLMVDSEPLWFQVERAFAARRGGEWTEALALPCTGRGLEATLLAMQQALGFHLDMAQARREVVEEFIARVEELELKRGCLSLLSSARVPLAVASSSPLRLIHAVLDRFHLRPCFQAIVSGEQVEHPKPAPDIFLRAAALLGVPPPECVVLEDSLAGATAGRSAGMYVIAVPEGSPAGRGFEAVADAILPDLEAARVLLGQGPQEQAS